MLLFLLQLNVFQLIKPLERFPALLSLLYLAGVAFVVFILVLFVVFNRRRKSPLAVEPDENLPEEVRKRLGARSANRALWVFRVVFVALAFSVFGFHVYWALYAAEKDPRFAVLEKRDIRVKRVSKSQLSGWILDRDGDLNNAFAYWKIEKNKTPTGREDEDLARVYPLDKEMAHLLGTERGTPGLEYNLFKNREEPTPEALEVLLDPDIKKDENRDVRLTIDHELQRFAYEQLKDKRGAIVVLNPQNGEVLAVAGNPTYSLYEAQDRRIQAFDRRLHRDFRLFIGLSDFFRRQPSRFRTDNQNRRRSPINFSMFFGGSDVGANSFYFINAEKVDCFGKIGVRPER